MIENNSYFRKKLSSKVQDLVSQHSLFHLSAPISLGSVDLELDHLEFNLIKYRFYARHCANPLGSFF